MLSSPIRGARVALALALAALAAPSALLAGAASASAPAAHVAIRRCVARGRAGARSCKRAVSKVPAVGTTLTSADQKLRLTVVAGRVRKKAAKFVNVEWDMTATCSTGPAGVHLRARALIRGTAFTSNVSVPGLRQQLTGRFASAHKATGHVRVTFPGSGGTCDTGVQRFTAQG